MKRRGEYVGNNQGKHTAPRALRGYRVMRRDGVCFACTCVVDVVRTTRRSAFLFRSYSSSSARVSLSLEPLRTRASAALDFLGAGLRHIPLAGQRADGEGGSGGVGSSNEGGAGKRWFGSPSRAPFAVSDQSITPRVRGSRKRSTWLYLDPSAGCRHVARSRTGFVRLQASCNCRNWELISRRPSRRWHHHRPCRNPRYQFRNCVSCTRHLDRGTSLCTYRLSAAAETAAAAMSPAAAETAAAAGTAAAAAAAAGTAAAEVVCFGN